ncbi:unnamed protein product, partial [Iphiclides podalirius]
MLSTFDILMVLPPFKRCAGAWFCMSVVFALVAAASAVPVDRNKRSFYQYSNPEYYTGSDQYYVNQASSPVYSASPALYSSSLYNTQGLSQPTYRVPVSQTGAIYQPSVSYTSPSYVTVQRPEVYSPSRLYPAPLTTQVSSPALYNAEHSSHASSSSVYRVQAPASVTYSVQAPRAQYMAAPSTWQNNGNSWNLNNPWC